MPDPICSQTELASALESRENLFTLLRTRLSWPVEEGEAPFVYRDDAAVGRVKSVADLSQIVPFSAGDPFVIFLVEFRERFRRTDLREILRGVRGRIREEAAYKNADLDELIFVCTVRNDETPYELRFVRFEERENRQPKLRAFGFDGDSVGETHTLRTVNLPLLRLRLNLMDEVDWSACRKDWQDAWNVEKVTRDFFRDYRRIFETVRDKHITGVRGEKQLFTQRLFNRLMFIHFLSKKGWLEFAGRKDYLAALYGASKAKNENFYHDRLYWVFFNGLGLQSGATTGTHSRDELVAVRGKVPYLNGGLFEMTDEDDVQGAVTIDNAAFDLIFDGLFFCYNFTVSESTPDDQDVAVDPEMLGKVFEELVTGRHESGSYYTPRPVVQFMCREALKGYLAPCGAGIEKFVDFHDAADITNHEAVLSALRSVKAVDPACGSGAYLLGLLQELMALRMVLFNAKKLDDASRYQRKLEIIQNSIYGVDLDPFAVNTARLRLWLSLVVEDTRNPLADPTISVALPNLDFKIEQGDSVSCPDPTGGLQLELYREHDLRDLAAKQRQHGDVNFPGDKPALKREIDVLARTIKRESKLDETAFDWRVDFGGVFQAKEADTDLGGAMNFGGTLAPPPEPGGFDIVLANPPYVRMELFKDIKPILRKNFPEIHSERADLYCYFYARAIELLKDGGQLVFITPNKWFRAGYGEKLRSKIADTCCIRSITDFGDLPVFESATTYAMIFIAQKGSAIFAPTWVTEPKNLEPPYPDVATLVRLQGFALSDRAISGSQWKLSKSDDRVSIISTNTITLNEYVSGAIYRGIVTGLKKAFVINREQYNTLITVNPQIVNFLKRFSAGKDCRRWMIENTEKYLIYLHHGVSVDAIPEILDHLSEYRYELESRSTKQKWYEIQQPQLKYNKYFEGTKIVTPDISDRMRFSLDLNHTYLDNTAYFIPSTDLFLLGVLNSSLVEEFYIRISSQIRGGYLRFFKQYVEQIPIPNASDTEKAVIAALVQQCLDRRGQDVADLEAEINARVAALYGL